ncbi:MAG: VWA domain-containing protein [Proteobacteria bacterium]|nr:VWA domain-containing protein [Pseudomonadota bacterium]
MKTLTGNPFSVVPAAVWLFLLITGAAILSPGNSRGGELSVEVRPENTTILHNSDGMSNIRIQVLAPEGLFSEDRPPLNLCLVLDKSGSMADSGKMGYLIEAAHMLVDGMGPRDILSIVAYDDGVRVPVTARRVRDRQLFHRAIDQLYPGGRTYLSGGLEEGFRQVRKNLKRGYVSRVILLSDGLANAGVTDNGQLRRRASLMYEDGVSISTFGLGLDFDEDLLTSLACGAGGAYYYISQPGDILSALDREFRMASDTVVSKVRIVIKPMGGCRLESIPGHSWSMEDGAAVIEVGDLGAGQSRTLLAKIRVPADTLGELTAAEVIVRYRDALTGAAEKKEALPVRLGVVGDPRVHRENLDGEVSGSRAVIESSALMNEAAKMVDKGDKAGAALVIRKALEFLESAPQSGAVKSEARRVRDYSANLESLEDMAPSELEEMQKEMKYRNYKEIYGQ